MEPSEAQPDDGPAHILDLRAVREMLHDALHELAVINTLAARVATDESCSAEAAQWLEYIQQQTVTLSEMLRTVFLSRLQTSPINVGRLLDEIAATSGTDVRITVRVEDGAPRHIVASEVGLHRILRNLVDNAVRAAAPAGDVEITACAAENAFVIVVDDSGPGFGCGPAGLAALGLSIVGRLVEEIGGSVEVGTSHLGGARVTVSLSGLLLVEAGGEHAPLVEGADEQ